MPSLLDTQNSDFDSLVNTFEWDISPTFNVAVAVCDQHADGSGKLALITETEDGDIARYTFDELQAQSNKLANVFRNQGVGKGDRVAVILPQRIETALVHLASLKLAAVSLPLSVLFGNDALLYRLQNSGSSLVVCTTDKASQLEQMRDQLPDLKTILVVDSENAEALAGDVNIEPASFWSVLRNSNSELSVAQTSADDPAFLLYTSGTTGPPKGALIAHRALVGNLTGFELSHNGFPEHDDCVYTPADWAWTGGLLDALMPAWFYAVPVVAYANKKFDVHAILSLMSRHKVTCAFIPPTALKMIRSQDDILQTYPLSLRSIMSAGGSGG